MPAKKHAAKRKQDDPLSVWLKKLPYWNFWWEWESDEQNTRKWFGWVDTGPNSYISVEGTSFPEVVQKATAAGYKERNYL